MIVIPLKEGPDWSDQYTLTPGQVAAVCGSKDFERDHLKDGRWQFRTHQKAPKVGAIRLGNGDDSLLFRITPKIPIRRLMFLVEYAEHAASARWDEEEVTAREEEGVVAAVARAFGRATMRALRSGVLQGYREVDDDLTVVRGRIRAEEYAESGYSLGLSASYDDFTPDIPENRLLRAAAGELLHLPELKDDVRDMLRDIERRMAGVSSLRPKEGWRPTRLNAHYYRALNLGELVLRGNSYELDGDSGIATDGLLISVSPLFEDFVAVALRRALNRFGECLVKQNRHLSVEGTLRAQTDLEYYARGNPDVPAAIIDAKYTVLGSKDQSRRIQQMVTYCYRFEASRGFIVYAQGSESGPISHRVRDITITEYPLDLDQHPREVRKQIDDLAEAIAGGRVGCIR